MPIEKSTTEMAAVVRVPAPPPHQCPLVAAMQALLLPAMVVTGILLLAVAWRRRSTNSKTASRTDLSRCRSSVGTDVKRCAGAQPIRTRRNVHASSWMRTCTDRGTGARLLTKKSGKISQSFINL
mmetsp:Transcript_31877/g.79514  ORF Transcript_31877/g.79514 Transcript_31877/m.79514 type:complete len:125 (+) Transcript_31877:1033-1407(+)